MKNKLMERPLMGANVRQRIEDEMLCLTDLAKIYEAERIENGWVEKRLNEFFINKSEIEYIIEILSLQNVFINTGKIVFMEKVKKQSLISALKSIGQYKVTGKGANKITFCNPYIFVAVAQWLNPKFRAQITMWVTDSLILNRIEAGTQFNELCNVIKNKIVVALPEDSNSRKFIFSNFAKLINKKVFGKHETNLRQIATKEQLLQLARIEGKLSALIDFGSITSYQAAKEYLQL